MAFSFRKIISNFGYMKKTEEAVGTGSNAQTDLISDGKPPSTQLDAGDAEIVNFERTEPDSTSIHNSLECSTSLKLPDAIKNFHTKRGSFSDTDLLAVCVEKSKKEKKKLKNLKLDVKRANHSSDDITTHENVENTPTHVLLECKSSEVFSERLKQLDFSKSFEIDSEHSSFEEEEDLDIQSLSDDDISLESDDKSSIKMCRKVGTESQSTHEDPQNIPSTTPESFGDVEVDKNEEERTALLLNYQLKLENMESVLNRLLTDFQFHIEVSKIFNSRSFVTSPPGTVTSNFPKLLGNITDIEKIHRGISPTGSWNVILEKEDEATKAKIKSQLESIQNTIQEFITTHLKNKGHELFKRRSCLKRSNTYELHKGQKLFKKLHINNKKKMKHFDFPDIRDAMLKLFYPETETTEEADTSLNESKKCICHCHETSQTDSGLTSKFEERSMSITSSLGNFSLDASTLSAYSESLDQIISYNSFQDVSLYATTLQKAAIERITFYVQVHSIQLKCETAEQDFESKNVITFHCPACKTNEVEESCLLKHILSQRHCEKIHFLYKTAYIKKCVASSKEIQPSTVLNPMKMYRDDNKIVCFGDAVYACSLCFENLIIGESILMAHCSNQEHIDRRDKLQEILE